MRAEYKTIRNDNIATAIVLFSLFIGAIAAVANSQTVSVNQAAIAPQQMETIVITAQRMPVEKMAPIIVSISRHADILIAAK